MKTILLPIGAAMVAILVILSAGCVSPSAGNTTSPGTPGATPAKIQPVTPALPGVMPGVNPLAIATTSAQAANPEAARKGDTVAVYYTGTFENGTVFDSNMDKKPVEFTLGNSTVIDGIDEAVTGMVANEQKTVTIPAAKAYGEYNASLIRTVNRTGPIANTSFVVGKYFSIHNKETDTYSFVKILDVNQTTVTWDGNNPLAGTNFVFTLKLAGITRP
jgi:peptidylprolyl isomerase